MRLAPHFALQYEWVLSVRVIFLDVSLDLLAQIADDKDILPVFRVR
jgi:hypothetical protein